MQIAIIFMTIFQPLSTQQHIILKSQMPVAFNQSIVGPLRLLHLHLSMSSLKDQGYRKCLNS